MLSVKDHTKFSTYYYTSLSAIDTYKLGSVLLREFEYSSEIGVVIQILENGELKTDIWSDYCQPSAVRHATLEEVENIRPELLQDILITY